MTARDEEPALPDGARLDDRVLATLHGLNGRIAFSGLKRALGAHPESLSRTLRRLEREGRIERVEGAYRALEPASSPADGRDPEGVHTVAQLELPPGVDPASLFARLSGRWFGTLRWMGVLDRRGHRWMVWGGRDSGARVLLELRGGRVRVGVPGPAYDDDPGEAEDSAFELLSHVVEAIRLPVAAAPAGGVRTFESLPSELPVWPN
jgi:hypothetical protein